MLGYPLEEEYRIETQVHNVMQGNTHTDRQTDIVLHGYLYEDLEKYSIYKDGHKNQASCMKACCGDIVLHTYSKYLLQKFQHFVFEG